MVLGRPLDSVERRYIAGVENTLWFVEREIVLDLFAFVEQAHGKPFWDLFLESEVAFEASIYQMHIQARKLETGPGSIFSRYRVLETERELIRFGLAPGFHHNYQGDLASWK